MKNFKLPQLVKDKKMNGLIFISLTAFVLYLLWKQWKKNKAARVENDVKALSDSNPTSTGTVNSKPKPITNTTVLKRGDKADRVQWIQYYFNLYVVPKKQGLAKLTEDGIFGEKTEKAVKEVMGKNQTSWADFKNKVDSKYKI